MVSQGAVKKGLFPKGLDAKPTFPQRIGLPSAVVARQSLGFKVRLKSGRNPLKSCVPDNPYPPNFGGGVFTPQISGVGVRKYCKTSAFRQSTPQNLGGKFHHRNLGGMGCQGFLEARRVQAVPWQGLKGKNPVKSVQPHLRTTLFAQSR